MADVDPGEVFIKDLLLPPAERHKNTENLDVTDTKDFDDDANHFTTGRAEDTMADDIFGTPAPRPGNENELEQAINHHEHG